MRRLREIEPEPPVDGLAPDEIRIVDFGERDLVRPGGKKIVRRSIPSRHRRTLAVIGSGALALAAVWSFSQPRAAATHGSPSASPLAAVSTPTVPPTSPTTMPSDPVAPPVATDFPTRTPVPLAVPDGGWAVKLFTIETGPVLNLGPIGPDGTVHMRGAAPIDAHGQVQPDWMRLPDGDYLVPEAFGPDGSAYGVSTPMDGTASLWAFDASHEPRFQYSLAGPDYALVAPGPASSVFILARVYPPAGGSATYHVTWIDDHGGTTAQWQLGSEPFPPPPLFAQAPLFIVRDDGTILTAYTTRKVCAIHVLDLFGQEMSNDTPPCWDRLTQAADGTLVGQSCETAGADACGRTRVAVLDHEGVAKPGWPQSIAGAASPPSFGADGALHMSYIEPDGNKLLTVLEPDGRTRQGWPVPLDPTPAVPGTPVDMTPPGWPVIGDHDLAYVQSATRILAYDPSGHLLPGWPVELGILPSYPLVYTHAPGGLGLVGVAAGNRMLLLDETGQVRREYADGSPDFQGWREWRAAPGGLVGVGYHSDPEHDYLVVAFLPAGEGS
jgi:hypothetical protein